MQIADISTALRILRSGRPLIVTDSDDRENEGDLVVPAQFATPAIINFMMTHCRGLICLALPEWRLKELGLPCLETSERNATAFGTAFAMPIDARRGVTTGVSANDRARTVAAAIDPATSPADLVWPGHLHTLAGNPDGVLARAGHTEASLDLAALAGLTPAAVICEITRADGEMARRPDLISFAREHDLSIATIDDLITYRLRAHSLDRCHAACGAA